MTAARPLAAQITVVYKFGGSSVATAERMIEVAEIVCSFQDQAPLVVLSAMGKVNAGRAARSCSPVIQLMMTTCHEAVWCHACPDHQGPSSSRAILWGFAMLRPIYYHTICRADDELAAPSRRRGADQQPRRHRWAGAAQVTQCAWAEHHILLPGAVSTGSGLSFSVKARQNAVGNAKLASFLKRTCLGMTLEVASRLGLRWTLWTTSADMHGSDSHVRNCVMPQSDLLGEGWCRTDF